MTMKMKTKEAVEYALTKDSSNYAVAKKMQVTANMIANYLKETRMRRPTAARFLLAYGIEIADVYDPTADAKAKGKT